MKNWLLGMVLAVATALGGCAALQNNSDGARVAIQAATLKVIDNDAQRAESVAEVAAHTRNLVTGESTATLNAVEERTREEIDWSRLDTAETLVVNNLIDAVHAELDARIDKGTLDAQDRVAVRNVLGWIEQAARMGGADVD